MSVGFQGVAVVLGISELLGELLTELGLRHTSGPQTETHGKLLGDGLALFILLGEVDAIGADLLHAGVGQDVDLIVSEAGLA